MSNDPQNKKFKQWLDILQQESWQLELIISGFAIYGLFMIIEPIEIASAEAQNNDNMYRIFMMQGLLISWYILTINLLIHVVLRGLWIGAIGLRYVSGDIDYDELNYSTKFKNHLLKRVGSFDNYVAKLEKYCSIIFAVTFLLLFYLLGLLALSFLFTLLGLWIDSENTSYTMRYWVAIPLVVALGIGTVLTFIDFVTQGWLKRKKWTSWFYYPIYWLFKYLTLSFLYRPIVYNFLDTKFGRRLSLILVPLYLVLTMLAGTGFSTSNYWHKDLNSNSFIANVENYDDSVAKNTSYVSLASIPSKVITDKFLSVFIVYGRTIEDDVFYFNKKLKPEVDNRGLHSTFQTGKIEWQDRRKLLKEYMATIKEMYRLKIDSTSYDFDFVFTQNNREQEGFETFLDIEQLVNGKHVLEVARKDHLEDSVYYRRIIRIPFWYYPK
ncbi:hypothetical protein DKG77_14420 [Flagellimonas aquimarina]|jgi:hypothetical protein|uniref:Uncharacterized protein n=1 Tax=Flagellimonas aquimarina TaxID=2201895 RepID=A0A316L024_9FLAO|nr:hypothetical protein [Allomuricauda koreensis]PWL37503.1 hypothetical protein DKG77_14420 [Allomuricauda koreensis]